MKTAIRLELIIEFLLPIKEKNMKRIISILLVIVACFSFLVSGCGDNNQGDNPVVEQVSRKRYQGTHIFNVSESNSEYLFKNGLTEYKVVIPQKSTKYTNLASTELQTLFREATGIQLVVERETGKGYSHDKSQKFISIGNTELFKSTGIEVDKTLLKKEGYRIVTKDNNIYLFTSVDVGNLYAVYELMEILFNFEYYYYDCYEIDTGVVEKKLPILDVTDVPDFNVRKNATTSIRTSTKDINAVHRMRFSENSYMLNLGDEENGQTRKAFHNSGEIFPTVDANGNKVVTDEQQWHASDNNQLCYTAHGDAESYERMYKRAAYVVEQALKQYPTEEYPDYMMASISCEDEYTFCSCTTCAEHEAKYGSKSAAIIQFLNNVMVEVRAWMDRPENQAYKRDEFYLMFFAYFAYLPSPAHYDEQLGKYVLNGDLQFRDDVGVMYAISDVTSTVSMYDKANEQTKKNSEMWFDVAPATYIWTYSGNTDYLPSMWPSYEHLDEDGYNFYACGNSVYFQDYIDYSDYNNTGFQALKLYIDSQMLWDCSQNIADLKDKWFNAMFGESKDIMRQLFEQELSYVTNVYDEKNARVSHGWGMIFDSKDWALTELESWIRLLQQAQEKNARLYKESEPEKYAMITNHINLEFYFPALAIVMSQTKDTAGQIYIDVVKYLQANADSYKGFYMKGTSNETNALWKDIVV